ncbi:hypothetical protein bcere0022_8060 [Bacillus cereus Rock3-44]|nr:hypothetical protein bcere0022_8060 [Bacillus cereus Rock3-44]
MKRGGDKFEKEAHSIFMFFCSFYSVFFPKRIQWGFYTMG